MTIWLVKEASERIINPQPIEAETMVITAVAGLFFNIVQMKILHGSGHGHSHDHDHDHDHVHKGEDDDDHFHK